MPPTEIIDLTCDDDVPASAIIDLASVYDLRGASHVSSKPEVKVEDDSSTLAGSSAPDSGESSPKSQQDNNIAQTESNPTDVGDLSPRNLQDQGDSSSDDNLTLGTILARSKKRKRDSDDARNFESKSSDVSIPLTPRALNSLVGSQSVKPGFHRFFSVRKQTANESQSEISKKDEKSKTPREESASTQQGGHSAKNANPHILNIVREEVFGQKKKKSKHRTDPSSQEEPRKQHIQVDEQAFSTPAPPRAVSEPRETVRPKKKIENYGIIRPSQTRMEDESERPYKRRKHSNREDTAFGSTSTAATSDATRSQVASSDKHQGHRSKTNGAERSRLAGKDKAIKKSKGSSRYRPGNPRPHRMEEATSYDRQQKKVHVAREREKVHKSKLAASSRQLGEKAYLVAAPNGRGEWARTGFQRPGMASQKPLNSKYGRQAASGRNEGFHEGYNGQPVVNSVATGSQLPLASNSSRKKGLCNAGEESRGLNSAVMGFQVPLESNTGHTARAEQIESLHEEQEVPDVHLHQSQRIYGSGVQQESIRSQSRSMTAQPARRLDQVQQTMAMNDKDLETTRAFFSKHPSQLAQQRKTMFLNSIPPDVGKPSYPDRHPVLRRSTGERFGRKRDTAIQTARKRAKYREKQIRLRRERLEAHVNEVFPNESEDFKEQRIEAGLTDLRKKYAQNDEKREAEKAQGLLTVKFIEDSEGAEDDPLDGPPAAAPKGKRRGIPVAKALEPGATIQLYVVYKSEPFEKGKKFGDYELNRMEDQFFSKEDANKHAEAVLRDDRYDGSHLVSIQFRVGPEDGLFFGTKELADGKLVMCMVQRERQMSSDLDLRDIFVRKELKKIYCPRYDVFHTYVIPKVFLEEDEASIDGGDKDKESKTPTPDVGDDEPEPGENKHMGGDSDSLFSASPTPNAVFEDESDAESVATTVTLDSLQPNGNMGSLSWDDVDYVHEHVGSFTTLELANKEAVRVALDRWRPGRVRLESWLYYRDAIKPSLEEAWAQDLDVEAAELEFEVPEFEGHVNDRPWRFIHSKVYVKETRLEGPRDIGNYIVTGNRGGDDEQSGGQDGEDDDEDGEDD